MKKILKIENKTSGFLCFIFCWKCADELRFLIVGCKKSMISYAYSKADMKQPRLNSQCRNSINREMMKYKIGENDENNLCDSGIWI